MIRSFSLIVACCLAPLVSAYTEDTHEDLAVEAMRWSVLDDAERLREVDLTSIVQRFPNSEKTPQPIADLFRFGARLEDRVWPDLRMKNHFYDPVYDRPLTIGGVSYFSETSMDWVLRGTGQDDETFSYERARAHFAEALASPALALRERAWGLTFQNLGHVIHHIQDMAQPQHVRNDVHLDTANIPWVAKAALYPFRDPSLYEAHTAERVPKVDALIEDGFEPVTFSTAEAFWANEAGTGLAQFTNANFVSKDSNFEMSRGRPAENARYARPVPSESEVVPLEHLGLEGAAALCERLKNDPKVSRASEVRCNMEFVANVVEDRRIGQVDTNHRAAALSLFDEGLESVDGSYLIYDPDGRAVIVTRVFTLNRFTFEAAYRTLLPKAVAYSAGFINHFFRGRLTQESEVRPNDLGMLQFSLRNVSAAGNTFREGTFAVYYEARDGTRKPLKLVRGDEVGTVGIPVDGVHELIAEAPEDVDTSVDHPFVAVFQGIIGAEQGVAGLVLVGTSLRPGFLANPPLIPLDRIGGTRLIVRQGGAWVLTPDERLSGGSKHWKGAYRANRPTEVLSWDGSSVSRDGKSFAVAPGKVFGAAMMTDSAGAKWLVVITNDSKGDHVQRRPFKRSATAEGWTHLLTVPRPDDADNQQDYWHFNGAGTEAQTLRETRDGNRTRLKIRIHDDVAIPQDLGNTFVRETSSGFTETRCADRPTARSESTVVTSGESIVAVDYRDLQEVIATIRTDGYRKSTASSGEWSSRIVGSSSYVVRLKQTLVTPWGEVPLRDFVHEASISGTLATSVSATSSYRDMRARIVFFQLGSGLLVTEAESSEGTKSAGSTDEDRGAETTTEKEWREVHLRHDGGALPVYAAQVRETETTDSYSTWQRFSVLDAFAANDCYGEPGEPRSWSTTRDYTETLPYTPFFWGSAATDRDGQLFVSFAYHDDDGRQRTFHHLTGADPLAVFGIPQPEEPFWVAPN